MFDEVSDQPLHDLAGVVLINGGDSAGYPAGGHRPEATVLVGVARDVHEELVPVLAAGQVAAQGSADDLLRQTGQSTLEDAFVSVIGSGEGLQ